VKKELREDQTSALEALRDAVGHGKRRICMQAPTGFGKTVLSAVLIESALERKKRVLFTVPLINLVDQTIMMLGQHGITEVGVIQAHHHLSNWDQPIQIASIQTLMKRTIPPADVVLIDEVHKWFTFYEKWLSKDRMPEWGNIPIIGLSATPWTRGLGSWFDHFHRASTTQELIEQGLLSPFKVYAPTHPDLSDIRTVGGDYHEGELSDRMSNPVLVADAVDTWIRLGENRPTLCYAVDRAHAKHLQQKFEASGIRCGYQDAYTKDDERRKIKRDFHDGTLKVVCNVGTLTTGIDWDVRCISMCRPTKSDMLFVQIVGRGLRTAPGKDYCLILDHSDNHTRLGFVTDIDESYLGLHKGKTPNHSNRVDGIRLPKECPSCHYLKPPKMAKCPACGFVAQVQSKIEVEDGELRELRPKPKQTRDAELPQTPEAKLRFYAELRWYALRHGYKPGWAYYAFKERIGRGPGWGMDNVPPVEATMSTLRWITHRNIRRARGRSHSAWATSSTG